MPLRRSLVDSALVGVIYASCDAVAAPHGCIEASTARIIKIAWRHGKSESALSPMTACRRRTNPLSSCARITSAPTSFHSCADGRAVLGKAWRQTPPSRQQWLAGARAEGMGCLLGCKLSFTVRGRTNEVERNARVL